MTSSNALDDRPAASSHRGGSCWHPHPTPTGHAARAGAERSPGSRTVTRYRGMALANTILAAISTVAALTTVWLAFLALGNAKETGQKSKAARLRPLTSVPAFGSTTLQSHGARCGHAG